MNANLQKSLDVIKDELSRGLIDSTEANIRLVEASRFRIIKNRIPSDLRKSLMIGVKQGRLIRVIKKDNQPEYFYKPNFEYLAKEELYKIECANINALKSILGSNKF